MKLNLIKNLIKTNTPTAMQKANMAAKKAVNTTSYHPINDSMLCIANMNRAFVNFDSSKIAKLSDISFDKGVAKKLDGSIFDGIAKGTLKNGRDIEITYRNGRWIKSSMKLPSTNIKVEKFANYDNNCEKIKSVSKVILQNDDPKIAYITKISEDYIQAKNNLNVNTMRLAPLKNGQKMTNDELLRCYGTEVFNQYNPVEYTRAGILSSDKSHVFIENKRTGKWEHQGIVDNLKRLYQ